MNNARFRVLCVATPTLLLLAGGAVFMRPVAAQNQEMQERVAGVKQAATENIGKKNRRCAALGNLTGREWS